MADKLLIQNALEDYTIHQVCYDWKNIRYSRVLSAGSRAQALLAFPTQLSGHPPCIGSLSEIRSAPACEFLSYFRDRLLLIFILSKKYDFAIPT